MMASELDIDGLQAWIGRTERREDRITPAGVEAMAATLDRDCVPGSGAPLPPLWHWAFFTPRARRSDMGADGHPRLGGFMPPIPLPRRMWAGGRLRFVKPLMVGDAVTRETEILKIACKDGKEGPLVFVTLAHRFSTAQGIAIEEEQDLVYRTPPAQTGSTTIARQGNAVRAADWRDPLSLDSVTLFRYSALTFNAHRIHYDAPYATAVEGYPGLVVQGPLIATLLAERLGARRAGCLATFEFRGLRPLFVDEMAQFCGDPAADGKEGFELWAERPDGSVAMSASATMSVGQT